MTIRDFAIRAIGAIIAVCLVYSAYHRIFIAPRKAKEATAEATLQAEMAEGQAAAAQEAIAATVQVEHQKVIVDRVTVENDHVIKQAEGADVRLPELKSALDRALCVRDAYKAYPDCSALPGAGGGVEAPGSDARGRPAE